MSMFNKKEEKTNYKLSIITIAAIIILVLFSVLIIFKQSDKEKLYGTWKLQEYSSTELLEKVDYVYQLTFYKDNTATLKTDDIIVNYKYNIDNKNITLTTDDEFSLLKIDGTYSFKIKGKKLILNKNDEKYTFKKNTGY